MSKIVKELVKIDLHIHSVFSKKDGKQVENNTIENIPVLMKNLEKEKVNLIAVTDHNAFNYNLYKELVKNQSLCSTLKTVLPGIEFDVYENEARFHVIAVFDNTNEAKVKHIEDILKKYTFDNKPKKANAFKLSTFRSIVSDIGLNAVIIAHQKSGIRVENQNENLAGVGEELFDYIISCDYFDALEFRSGKVEGILKGYQAEKDLKNMRYITGTDCHDWLVYPQQSKLNTSDIRYTYIRSLATFKGLAMALTDSTRITTAFYEINKAFVPNIKLTIAGETKNIELSPRMNVIIGDNSIGKSMILEYLYNPNLIKVNKAKKEGYKSYCKSKQIEIYPIDNNLREKIKFDRQGEIRNLFLENRSLNNYPQFQDKFKQLQLSYYEEIVNNYVNRVIDKIKYNYDFKIAFNELDFNITIPCDVEDENYLLHSIANLDYYEKDYSSIIENIKIIIMKLKLLLAEKYLFDDDKIVIQDTITTYTEILNKYLKEKTSEEVMSKVVSTINKAFIDYEKKVNKQVQDQERKKNNYNTDMISFKKRILNYVDIKYSSNNQDILFDFEEIKIKEETNSNNGYRFITKTIEPCINKQIIEEILMYPFSNQNSISYLENVDKDNFASLCADTKIRKYLDEGKDINTAYKDSISNYMKSEILKLDYAILKEEDAELSGNSPGKNALIYLDLFSDETTSKMYIVDQPGDDVSQNKITTDLIEIFRKIADKKQVLFITHKPELVVNLDVDNVIVLKNTINGVQVTNGALEYEDDEVNILNDVANILDGGAEIIRKRWKRYEKRD